MKRQWNPADVQAAGWNLADVWAALEAWFAPPCPADMDGLNARMTAALAAADKMRAEGVGNVVARLEAVQSIMTQLGKVETASLLAKAAALIRTLRAQLDAAG